MKKITIVEDTVAITDILKFALKKNGYESVVYTTGEEFIENLDKEFDLLILDLMLPGITGEEILSELKDRNMLSNIKLLIYSAVNNPQEIADKFPETKSVVLQKPARIDEIIGKVKLLLED